MQQPPHLYGLAHHEVRELEVGGRPLREVDEKHPI